MSAQLSKARIDKAGSRLSNPNNILDEECLELEDVFDKYRELHLAPLSKLAADIQNALNSREIQYYIAQRLKRRPQILRKLRRFHSRLTQLQDIGGLRIVVENNKLSDEVSDVIDKFVLNKDNYILHRNTDYRPDGRDDSGYRALHKIVSCDGVKLEIQIRSRAQHCWAESIERTSVFYGKRLKEGEGSKVVHLYFKNLSNAFALIEKGNDLYQESLDTLSDLRSKSEEIIRRDGHSQIVDSEVNEDIIRTLIQIEASNPARTRNWILVFEWSTAKFITWQSVSLDPGEAVKEYAKYEKQFPEQKSYEVVLIGSSSIEVVRKTHSHYFGISSHDKILEDLGQHITKITDDNDLNKDSKKILSRMYRKKVWGMNKGIQVSTLKNHFCKDVSDFDRSINLLIELGYVINKGGAGVTLNISKQAEIDALI